jgi:ribose transport system substrate-binding protein
MMVLLILGTLAACGQKPAEPPSGSANKEAATQTSLTAGARRQLDIAVIPKGLTHQFWLTVKAGAEAAAKEFGVKIVWQGPAKETEVDRQISIVEDMISRKVNAIVMAACDENALIGVIKKATDAGIPVVTIDSGVKSDIPVSFVATDNIAGAKAAAQALAQLIGKEGKVGLIPFVSGAGTSEMREQGFKEGIAAFPNVKLAATLYSQSDAAQAMAVTEDMMTSHPDLKGVFAASEPSVVGAAQAVKAAGKAGQIKLVGFDASDKEISDLKDGTIQALVVQNPFKMGYEGVKAAVDCLQNKPVEKRIDTGVTVVTMENLNDPEVQKLLYPR